MKKAAALLLTVCMTAMLTACGGQGDAPAADGSATEGAAAESTGTEEAAGETEGIPNTVNTLDDLPGKTIGVQLGTTGDIYVDDIEDATAERFSKGFEAVQALLQGKVDAVVIDGEPAKVFVSQNEGLKLLDDPFTEEEYAIAISKDNEELLEKVNTALNELKEEGEFQKVIDKYIASDDAAEAETEAATEAK